MVIEKRKELETPKLTPSSKSTTPAKQKKQKGYVRRAIKRAEPKINENPKAAMFIRSTTANQLIMNVMRDFVGEFMNIR